jgi:hypothetical protein
MQPQRSMSDTVAGLRRQARRIAEQATARTLPAPAKPAGPPSGERLLILVSVSESQARAVITGPGWTASRVGQLRGEDGTKEWQEIAVVAGSVAELRRIRPWLIRAGRAPQLTLVALATDRVPALGLPTGLYKHRVVASTLTQPPEGPLVASLRVAESTKVHDLARAVLSPYRPGTVPAAGLRLGLTSADALAWAAGDAAAILIGRKTKIRHPIEGAQVDLLVGPDLDVSDHGGIPRIDVAEGLALPPVDTAVISPAGFDRAATGEPARLDLAADGSFVLRVPGAAPTTGELRIGLTENHIAALRPVRAVEVIDAGTDPLGLGRVLSQLGCAGVPTRIEALPAEVADALGEDLAERFRSPAALKLIDAIDREDWSVTTRRFALARFAPQPFWAARGRALGKPTTDAPSVSALLATRRAANLPFALAQLARQDWPELETVLVLHGITRQTPGVAEALAAFDRPLIVVEIGADVLFGLALDEGMRRCSGRLITKWDDDDWYGAHHVTDLVQAHTYSGAALVGISGYFAYLQGTDVTIRWTNAPSGTRVRWVHGGTILMSREDMTAVGGWHAVPRSVDAHLLKTVLGQGAPMYSIHDLGFLYYRGRDHTWTPDEGDQRWLSHDPEQWSGFRPPPQLNPLPHPNL